jgi:Flp pilus assembly protein TadD
MQRSVLRGAILLLIAWSFNGPGTAAGSGQRGENPLTGIVSIPAGERPQNVLVILSGPQFERSATAQPDGSFIFLRVPEGEYSIEVRCDGYFSSRTPIRHSSDDYFSEIVVPLGASSDDTPVIGSSPVVSVESLKIPEKARKEVERATREKENERLDGAIKHFRKAVEIYPEYFEAWNNLGTVYMRLGKKTEAEDAFQKAIALQQDSAPSLRNLGLLYLQTSAPAKAIPLLARACDVTEHRDVFAETYLGFAFYEEGRYPEAEACLSRALTLDPDFFAALYQQGFVKTRLGRYDEAKALFNRALELGAPAEEASQMRDLLSQMENLRPDEGSARKAE